MRETAVSRWGVSRETARDSARQRETAARQPRDSRESYVNLCNKLVAYRSFVGGRSCAPTPGRRSVGTISNTTVSTTIASFDCRRRCDAYATRQCRCGARHIQGGEAVSTQQAAEIHRTADNTDLAEHGGHDTLIVLFSSGVVECSSAIVGAHSSGLELETWEVVLAWVSLGSILVFYIYQTFLVARFHRQHAGDTWAPAEEPGSEEEVSDPIYRLVGRLRRCLRMKRKLLTRELGEFVQPEEDEAQPGKTERALWRAFTCGLTWLKKSERVRPGDEMDMLTLWLGDASGGARRADMASTHHLTLGGVALRPPVEPH
jgi:hypothetical protein